MGGEHRRGCCLGVVLCIWEGVGLLGGGASRLKEKLQNHRWQLLVPISADILRSLTWKKSTFYLKKKKKSPIKKCLDFSFCTHSLFLKLKCAPCSFVPLISLFFDPSSLQEADCADVDSKLLMRFANVHGGDVHNGQARGLLWSILDHRLSPLSCVFLRRGKKNTMAAK